MNLNTRVIELKGIGDKTCLLLNKVGINTVNDFIHYYPRTYDTYEYITPLNEGTISLRGAFYARVINAPKISRFNGKSILSFYITDDTATVEVRYFNTPYLLKAFKVGDYKVFRGILRKKGNSIILDQPKIYEKNIYDKLQGSITPIYPLTKDLSNEKIKKAIQSIVSDKTFNVSDEFLSQEELNEFRFLALNDSFKEIHFPKSNETQYFARRRIVFEEFLQYLDCSQNEENATDLIENTLTMYPVSDCTRLMEQLPYELTNAQKNAVNDILDDMQGQFMMNRVVQGDVGSGKTIVAIIALLFVAANGYQGAMMAPTEVLAKQHYENILDLSKKYNLSLKPGYIAGKMSVKDKKEILSKIENGEVNCIIGTHAIFQDGVNFKNLALAITDEQHRFGVKQRESFKNKGNEPHILVMSATPIPRTLAMIVFGGKSISVIDELPKNRIPISNCVINSDYRIKAYEKIRNEINLNHQVYVICPMVNENTDSELELKDVETHTKELRDYFGDSIRILSLNGKMKSSEKTRIMEDFKNHKADILVSTTVIEVGIDVPNATLIMIENAERFGLSTLHQLRGRVGRGNLPSYCILMSDSRSEQTKKRLNILNETNDGFKIAKEDMALRGPGELNGVRQSGELDLGLADIVNDSDLLSLAVEKYSALKKRGWKINSNLIDFRTI